MRAYRLILTVLIGVWVLFSQAAYVQSAEAASKPEPAVKPSAKVQAESTEADANEAKAKKPAPRITFAKVVHNFGKIGPGTSNNCEFTFTNTGDAVLKITRTSATCGCTIPKLAKKEYAPGESGTLKVNYKTGLRAGSTSKKVYVHTNDLTNSKVKLTLKARIVVKVDYVPKRLNLSLKTEDANCPDIILTSVDDEAFSIKSITSTAGCIKVDFDPSQKATKFVLKPKGDIERLEKSPKGNIEISLTHPGCKAISIPFEALSEFKLNPRAFIVFNAQPGQPEVRKLWVLNNYNEEFEIESASSERGTIKIIDRKKIGKARYQFDLEIIPPAADKNKKVFVDTFYIDIKGGKRLKARCRGFYAK